MFFGKEAIVMLPRKRRARKTLTAFRVPMLLARGWKRWKGTKEMGMVEGKVVLATAGKNPGLRRVQPSASQHRVLQI